ncbi:hypothetical protein LXA43DRAFT_1102587 [Ganoderma leucocontextum]|nr:hypothetical protein LXA43DRAFT_1102587 [Ganoderma leucocontextum]
MQLFRHPADNSNRSQAIRKSRLRGLAVISGDMLTNGNKPISPHRLLYLALSRPQCLSPPPRLSLTAAISLAAVSLAPLLSLLLSLAATLLSRRRLSRPAIYRPAAISRPAAAAAAASLAAAAASLAAAAASLAAAATSLAAAAISLVPPSRSLPLSSAVSLAPPSPSSCRLCRHRLCRPTVSLVSSSPSPVFRLPSPSLCLAPSLARPPSSLPRTRRLLRLRSLSLASSSLSPHFLLPHRLLSHRRLSRAIVSRLAVSHPRSICLAPLALSRATISLSPL